MDEQRVGRILRALRHRRSWRQDDVATKGGVSQDAVSRAERGQLEGMTLGRLAAIVRALEADLVVTIRWRAGDLDRLLDEGHAALAGRCAQELFDLDWDVRPEVTYSVWGERGSIDLLAWHGATRTLLVIEVKTELTSVEETLRRHDAKTRLASGIAADRFGWQARTVGRLLLLPDLATARRRVERHDPVLRKSYPQRRADVRLWLRAPWGAMSGLRFMSAPHLVRGRRVQAGRKRIRRPATSVAHSAGNRNATDSPAFDAWGA